MVGADRGFANEWVLDLGKNMDATTLDFQRPLLGLHAHRPRLPIAVGSETAPLPLLGSLHQSPLHRVVEIKEAPLPAMEMLGYPIRIITRLEV